MKIKKGDKVIVITGKYRGKSGAVEQVMTDRAKVRVAGLNVVKRHVKSNSKAGQAGGEIEIHRPISVSNVMLVCPHCDKPTRVGHQKQNNVVERICIKCKGSLK